MRVGAFVEYERVGFLKVWFLKLLFVEFLRERRTGSWRSREFDKFLSREGDLLERFATHCALDEYWHRRNPEVWVWTDWPEAYRDPESEETRAFRRQHWRSVMFFQYLQWQIDIQLRRAQPRAPARRLSIGPFHAPPPSPHPVCSPLWAPPPRYFSA